MRLLDWLGRLLLLVLSGLSTLAIIGSLMSASRPPPPPGAPAPSAIVAAAAPQDEAVAQRSRQPGEDTDNARAAISDRAIATAAPPPDRELARWLESLTYAVLALAGFAAAGVLVLLRITLHLSRIAAR